MADRQFEVSRSAFTIKCGKAILLGSLIPVWIFIIWNYFWTANSQGNYSAPVSILEMQLLCIPYFTYQLPAYLVSGMIFISFVKKGWIKSAIAAYLGAGISGWIISTLLLFILYTADSDYLSAMGSAFIEGVPSLLLYLWFLYPKPVE